MPSETTRPQAETRIINVTGQVLRVAIRPGNGTRTPLLLMNGFGVNLEVLKWFVNALDPAIEVIRLLEKDGAEIVYHDPYVPEFEEHGICMAGVPLTEELLAEVSLVIITANHSCIDYSWVAANAKHVLDTRNATKEVTKHREKITLL